MVYNNHYTYTRILSRYGPTHRRPRQTQHPAQARNPASSSRCGQRRVLSEQRFLRPSRSGAGQVRNAATRRGRSSLRQQGGAGVWTVPAFVLSGADGVPTKRPGRIDPAKTRTASRPQADPASAGLPRGNARRAAHLAINRTGAASAETLRGSDPPAHDQPSALTPSTNTPTSHAPPPH